MRTRGGKDRLRLCNEPFQKKAPRGKAGLVGEHGSLNVDSLIRLFLNPFAF